MEKTFTEELEAYNEALRVADKEETLRAEGRWTSAAKAKAWKGEMLDIIQEQANKEFNAVQDYRNGKIDKPVTYRTICGNKAEEPLYYFKNPEMFERDIANLDDCLGELTAIDQAWINNTRRLIQAYHAVVIGEAAQRSAA